MLQQLSITNYAIIENLELTFKNDFTVITGETGAGKSILLGALSLILGQRADTNVLNNKEKKCIVEGTFLVKDKNTIALFDEYDLDFESTNILRREINIKGKSRAFINDTPVSLTILKKIASELIDLHSQHQTLKINETNFQVNVIDAFAKTDKELTAYQRNYQTFKYKKENLNQLIEEMKTSKIDLSYIEFQINEIKALKLLPKEQSQIEQQLEIANNAEEIKQVLVSSTELLSHSDNSVASILNQIANSFSKISSCAIEYEQLYNRLNSLNIELNDVVTEIELLNDNANYEAFNIPDLTHRLNSIYSLNQKHQTDSTEELIRLCEKLESQLESYDSSDEKITLLREEVEALEQELMKDALVISRKRVASFNKLTKIIISNLAELGIPDASFVIKHQLSKKIREIGIDEIEYLFSANKGVDERALNKVASGGELSRLMLSIKSILAGSSSISTLIFDEIDTGVSGDIADKMATIMKQMSQKIQVISITHLPQVAAKGNSHFKIYKETINNKTHTLLDNLSKKDRVEEIAKMLSGKKLTDVARENAKTLLLN